MTLNRPSYYEYFGLTNFEPDQDKIKRAYRSMALKKHPDRGGSVAAMKAVNEVYLVLSKHKQQYDEYLRLKLNRVRTLTREQAREILLATKLFNFRKPY